MSPLAAQVRSAELGPFFVRDTGRVGLGLFSEIAFSAGDHVLTIAGVEREWRSVGQADALANPNWICVGENRWIDPVGAARFLNHSCAPTMRFREPRSFVALRDIAPGEELTFDYALTEDEPLWRMACQCSAHNCRREIRAIQFLASQEIEAQLSYVPAYFRRVWEGGRQR